MKKMSTVLFAFLVLSVFTSCLWTQVQSSEGAVWVKYSGNPLDLGTANVARSCVLYDGSMFKLWYQVEGSDSAWINYATSLDGLSWVQHGTVLDTGGVGSWDCRAATSPSVLYDGTTFKMWYVGYGDAFPLYGSVGYATSSDGIHWSKYAGNPVLARGGNGGWDDFNIGYDTVFYNGTHYLMWYVAQQWVDTIARTGIATSLDGVSWTKYAYNPVLVAGSSGQWDDRHAEAGSVLWNGSHYIMWWNGQDWASSTTKIGLATSPDGFSWTKYAQNPVLEPGLSGSWDARAVWNPSVIQRGNTLLMFYNGYENVPPYGTRLGLATSYAPYMPAEFFLHGGASLDSNSPTATTAKYEDSPSIKFSGGNPWKQIGTWTAPASLIDGRLEALSGLDVWLGLKNSDDQGTNFDLRAEVYKNGVLVASGETYLIKGVTRNPDKALKVIVSFGSFSPADFDGTTDTLSLKILTRIGTDGNGKFGGGHSSAVGLRLYFDAVSRPAVLAVSIS